MQRFLDGAAYKGPLTDYIRDMQEFKEQLAEHLNRVKREYDAINQMFKEFERDHSKKNLGRPVFVKGVEHYTRMLEHKGEHVLRDVDEEIKIAQAELDQKLRDEKQRLQKELVEIATRLAGNQFAVIS